MAKQAAEVDVLSGGRLRLGIGVGWNYVEYEALNEDFRNRGKRQEEQVEVLRRLWSERVVDYRGEHHRIDRAGILPLPERQIPIWFGGFSPVSYARAARLGDGFLFVGKPSVAAKELEKTRALVRDAGRDADVFGAELILLGGDMDDSDRWVDEVRGWQAAGGTHVSLVTMGSDLPDAKAHLSAAERFLRSIEGAGLVR